jgi:hypothetical protein
MKMMFRICTVTGRDIRAFLYDVARFGVWSYVCVGSACSESALVGMMCSFSCFTNCIICFQEKIVQS